MRKLMFLLLVVFMASCDITEVVNPMQNEYNMADVTITYTNGTKMVTPMSYSTITLVGNDLRLTNSTTCPLGVENFNAMFKGYVKSFEVHNRVTQKCAN